MQRTEDMRVKNSFRKCIYKSTKQVRRIEELKGTKWVIANY